MAAHAEARRLGTLIVDDDLRFVAKLVADMKGAGYANVRHVRTHGEAIHAVRDWSPARALVELFLPTRSGLQVAASLRLLSPSTKTLVHTTAPSRAATRNAIRLGAIDCAPKTSRIRLIERAFELSDQDAFAMQPVEMPAPTLERAVWEHIHLVLEKCEGNLSRAARLLGISRNTIKARISSPPPEELDERLARIAEDFMVAGDTGQRLAAAATNTGVEESPASPCGPGSRR